MFFCFIDSQRWNRQYVYFFVPPVQYRIKGVLKCVYTLHELRALRMLLPCISWRIHFFPHSTSASRWMQNTSRFIHSFFVPRAIFNKKCKECHNMDFSKTKKKTLFLSFSLYATWPESLTFPHTPVGSFYFYFFLFGVAFSHTLSSFACFCN